MGLNFGLAECLCILPFASMYIAETHEQSLFDFIICSLPQLIYVDKSADMPGWTYSGNPGYRDRRLQAQHIDPLLIFFVFFSLSFLMKNFSTDSLKRERGKRRKH